MSIKTGFVAVTLGMLAISPALAQPTLAQVTPAPAPGSKQVIPEKTGPAIQSGRSESLSRKLSNSGGVIAPSGNVDPGMKVPVPNAGHTMPVIPPSATGGGTAK